MHRSRISTKRGLTDIPAATILMFAVALMGVFLLQWSNQHLMFKSTELTDTFDDNINRLSEELVLEQVWFGTGPAGKFVNVTFSNISSIGISVIEIELVNSTEVHTITLSQNVFPGDTYSMEELYVWTTGTKTDVTITTARDNIIKTQVAP